MVIDSPSVSFANSVASVAMPEANLSAKYLGLGGASADTNDNRLSVNSALVLFNSVGDNVETVLNKNASTDDASLTSRPAFRRGRWLAFWAMMTGRSRSVKIRGHLHHGFECCGQQWCHDPCQTADPGRSVR